jgi:hypothetical protein
MNLDYASTPTWKALYEAALFETDTHEMLARIKEAERAILDRVEELLTVGDDSEREALSHALIAMRDLRRMYEGTANA